MNPLKIALNSKFCFYSVLIIGFSSIITQLIFIREFLSIFSGNELIIGIVLGTWFLLAGIGAYLARFLQKIKDKLHFLGVAHITLALFIIASIFLLRIFRNILFSSGELLDLIKIFFISFIFLLPFCVLIGILYPLLCMTISKKGNSLKIVYFLDSLAAIFGAILITIFLNHYPLLFLIMILNILASIFIFYFSNKKIISLCLIILASILIIFLSFINLDSISYKNQDFWLSKDSAFGRTVITKQDDNFNFYLNKVFLFKTNDIVGNEQRIHYAMTQFPTAKDILLVSGGISGTVNELLKYDITKIDYLEIDPNLMVLEEFIPKNESINIVTKDARLFIKKAKSKYDIIILDLPDPVSAQLNRFYTLEFFYEVKKILNEDGVLSLKLSSSPNYLHEDTIAYISSIYNTLSSVFKNVLIVPGENNYILSSDRELRYDFENVIEKENIKTVYFTEEYLKGVLTDERIKYVNDVINQEEKFNRDFHPISYLFYLRYWSEQINQKFNYILALFIIFLVLAIILYRPLPFSVFSTGLTSSSLIVIMLISFQIFFGYVYKQIGLLLASFMLGVALGSYYINKTGSKRKINDFFVIIVFLIVLSLILPFILLAIKKFERLYFVSPNIIFPLLFICLGFLVGISVLLSAQLYFKNSAITSSVIYNAHYFGAAIGAFFVSAFLIPYLGLINVCFFIAGLNMLGIAKLLMKY